MHQTRHKVTENRYKIESGMNLSLMTSCIIPKQWLVHVGPMDDQTWPPQGLMEGRKYEARED
jgi:hypothetical protein